MNCRPAGRRADGGHRGVAPWSVSCAARPPRSGSVLGNALAADHINVILHACKVSIDTVKNRGACFWRKWRQQAPALGSQALTGRGYDDKNHDCDRRDGRLVQ